MKKIFLVEDDNDIRELIKFILIEENYNVYTFSSAEAFRKRDTTLQPDLFLLDIRLPDGNGMELCKELKTKINTSKIPVVLMSAHTDHQVLKKSKANDFIAKPFDISKLTETIQQQLK